MNLERELTLSLSKKASVLLPPSGLVLDASTLINFLATEEPLALLQKLDLPFYVPKRVRAEIKKNPRTRKREEGLLTHLIDAEVLRVVSIEEDDDMVEAFFALVGSELEKGLGDGESAVIAYATARSLGLVLDDRKARDLYLEQAHPSNLYSTICLFQALDGLVGLEQKRIVCAVYDALKLGKMSVVTGAGRQWCRELLPEEQLDEFPWLLRPS